jgi:hypothetical protein
MGLAWLLHGRKLLAISAKAAKVAARTSGTLSVTKPSPERDGCTRILGWELS